MEILRKKQWWKKVEELGSGYFGIVCLAYSSGSSKFRVAVKSAEYDIPFAFDSLKREAEIFRHLAGAPNIVECIGEDTSVEDGNLTYNLLLEYAPNGTLRDVIQKTGKMPESRVAYFASMLLRGLAEIHSRGIVHCDIKPENILVFPGACEALSQLKIADFGMARFSSEDGSPESSSDIFAIGCIVYKMMMGKSTWEWKGLSKDGKDFLFRCLNANPQCRWSAKDLLMHPFIENNLRIMFEKYGFDLTQDEKVSRNSRLWISERDLFSDRMMEPAASCSYMNTKTCISS